MDQVIISALEPMLSVKQAAAFLQVPPATIYNWIYQKRLTSYRVGNGPRARIRFKLADLEGLLRRVRAKQDVPAAALLGRRGDA